MSHHKQGSYVHTYAELTALMSCMSSGKVCMKFMTLSLTGNLSTPPSCSGWKRGKERERERERGIHKDIVHVNSFGVYTCALVIPAPAESNLQEVHMGREHDSTLVHTLHSGYLHGCCIESAYCIGWLPW